jgi:hypothetical protein
MNVSGNAFYFGKEADAEAVSFERFFEGSKRATQPIGRHISRT